MRFVLDCLSEFLITKFTDGKTASFTKSTVNNFHVLSDGTIYAFYCYPFIIAKWLKILLQLRLIKILHVLSYGTVIVFHGQLSLLQSDFQRAYISVYCSI